MEPAVSLLAGMPVCYIYRQQKGRYRAVQWQKGAKMDRKIRCTETGVVYESIRDAAERTKISPNGIGSAASGMAGGYHWEYAED